MPSAAQRDAGRDGGVVPMTAVERALTFECRGEQLVGVLAAPETSPRVGVLIVVGGPQYRAGSHRQFVLLARRLAARGVATLRFDHRGIGDSTGSPPSFEAIADDIDAALAELRAACPTIERVVLLGLCDAASAALLYCDAGSDRRIAGLALLNPWVRSGTGVARTRLRHYYLRRLVARDFWTNLLRGRVAIAAATREVASDVRASRASPPAEGRGPPEVSFQDRMADGWRSFAGPILLVLSGRDLTAREFESRATTDPRWRDLLARANVERVDVPDADHTFSSARLRAEIEDRTWSWLRERCDAGSP